MNIFEHCARPSFVNPTPNKSCNLDLAWQNSLLKKILHSSEGSYYDAFSKNIDTIYSFKKVLVNRIYTTNYLLVQSLFPSIGGANVQAFVWSGYKLFYLILS